MFTIFDDRLDDYCRTVLREQREFERGEMGARTLASLQLDRIKSTLRHAKSGSPFYAERLRDWTPDAIDRMDEVAFRQVPFTTKSDLRTHMFSVPSLPLHKSWIYYETTGTTGVATPCPRNNCDSITNNTALTVCYRGIFDKHGRNHVVGVMGPTELHSTGDTFGDVLRNLGHAVVKMWPNSPLVGRPRALKLLRELEVTAMICTPGTAIALAKAARQENLDPRSDFHIRMLMVVGELATPLMLKNLGQVWNATTYNCMYASQEASILASCRDDGLLHTIPLNNYYEVLDPESQEPAASHSGTTEGELVITHLYQGSKPLVRYRTGDLVRVSGPVGASYPSATLQPIGRTRDRLQLGGRPVCAFDLESAIFADLRGCLDYQVTITTEDGCDVLHVRLEMIDQAAEAGLDIVALQNMIQQRLGVRARVTPGVTDGVTATGAMVSWKAARTHDRRTTTTDPERDAALAIARARAAQ